jgi:hypothetical protein
MLTAEQFIDGLSGLVESIPLHKALSERGLAFAWSAFPADAKSLLTGNQFAYACIQRTLDPDPNLKLAIQVQLLTYLYPMRDGMPHLAQGLRADLPDRMRDPYTFHPTAPINPAHRALPPADDRPIALAPEPQELRIERLQALARQTGINVPHFIEGQS